MTVKSKSNRVAFILSGLMPGLGQFYNQDWLKGIGFFIGAIVMTEISLSGISWEMIFRGDTPVSFGSLLFRLAALAAFWIWSIVDADRSAQRKNAAASSSQLS
ncbi:MAG TPA: hypothetical protein VI382_09465 [Candidatus Manganitrophaceae bacterium]|nr:hypothetical protein [Candidatus Manganitrophaceae bacterium]